MDCDCMSTAANNMLSDDVHQQELKDALMRSLLSAAPDPVPAPTMLRPPGPQAPAYALRSTTEQRQIWLLSENITTAWGVSSPATVFPANYHPDPDPSNWGLPLLTAILRLAERTRTSELMHEGIGLVCESIEKVNEGLSSTEGDWVIRTEDVEWAFGKIRKKYTDSYRPSYYRKVRRGDRGGKKALGSRGGRGGRNGPQRRLY